MAATTEGRIALALAKRLGTLTLDPVLTIAWPNIEFPGKNADGSQKAMPSRYLRVQFIPNATERLHINSDGEHRHIGIFQVSVHWPHGVGEIEPREVAGQIIAHFPCDLTLTEDTVHVRISKRPEAADMLVEKSNIQIPVSIEFEAYA